MSFTLKDLQIKLQHKHYLDDQADGLWGPKTAKAVEAWGRSGTDLDAPQTVPDPREPLPLMWLPACRMSRVVHHWTAGGSHVSATDKDHYHIIIDQDCRPWLGDHSISDNVNTSDGDYAAHTLNCNTGSIGIALCGMADAVESPFNPGPFPILEEQWKFSARCVAQLIKFYGIPLTDKTVLQHGEVEAKLKIKQRGKWDVMKLPWNPSARAGDLFRDEVARYL